MEYNFGDVVWVANYGDEVGTPALGNYIGRVAASWSKLSLVVFTDDEGEATVSAVPDHCLSLLYPNFYEFFKEWVGKGYSYSVSDTNESEFLVTYRIKLFREGVLLYTAEAETLAEAAHAVNLFIEGIEDDRS